MIFIWGQFQKPTFTKVCLKLPKIKLKSARGQWVDRRRAIWTRRTAASIFVMDNEQRFMAWNICIICLYTHQWNYRNYRNNRCALQIVPKTMYTYTVNIFAKLFFYDNGLFATTKYHQVTVWNVKKKLRTINLKEPRNNEMVVYTKKSGYHGMVRK